ncbi:outer membrane beta-barrel protein [Verrucomicrobiota bacterium]
MKRLLIVCLISCLALSVFGAPMQEGLYEIRTEASYDISDVDSDDFLTGIGGLGYYCCNTLQVGGLITLGKTPNDSYWEPNDVWGLGAFAEYSFNLSESAAPFAGASVIFLSADNLEEREDKATVRTFSIFAGMKLYLTDTVAISGQLASHWADEEIYDYDKLDEEGKKTDLSISVGLRFLL